jgi:hypothetical protein
MYPTSNFNAGIADFFGQMPSAGERTGKIGRI